MTGQMDKEYLARVDVIVGEVPPLEDMDSVVSEFYKERPEASGWQGKDVPKELMARVDLPLLRPAYAEPMGRYRAQRRPAQRSVAA